jgi:hypothetical protein
MDDTAISAEHEVGLAEHRRDLDQRAITYERMGALERVERIGGPGHLEDPSALFPPPPRDCAVSLVDPPLGGAPRTSVQSEHGVPGESAFAPKPAGDRRFRGRKRQARLLGRHRRRDPGGREKVPRDVTGVAVWRLQPRAAHDAAGEVSEISPHRRLRRAKPRVHVAHAPPPDEIPEIGAVDEEARHLRALDGHAFIAEAVAH